jgi:spore coat polysaccharide biosynthesis protein SpsF
MNGAKLGIIIQARMGSTRLPEKVLKPVGNRTLLGHIVERLRRLQATALTVCATSTEGRDDAVERFCRESGVACFRGSEQDVLDRYYRCAEEHGFTQVVRLTGDNPFPDMEELDRLISLHLTENADFSHSFRVLPIGVGAEIFTFDALQASWREGTAPHHREHVDEYLLENPGRFKTAELDAVPSKQRPEVRLTVDTEADYRRACHIAEHACSDPVTTEEAILLAERYQTAQGER